MTSTDPIADMLSRIRNAFAINQSKVIMPHSKIKETVAKILVDNGFLIDVKTRKDGHRTWLEITINPEGASTTITEIDRLSSPGRRVYVKSDAIPVVKHGRGLVVISTSKGVMTGQEAQAKKLGGELICQVY